MQLKQYSSFRTLLFSFLLHVVFFFFLVLSYEFTGKTFVLENNSNKNEIINATVVDQPAKKIAPTTVKPSPPKEEPVIKAKPTPVKDETPPPQKEVVIIPKKKDPALAKEKLMDQLLADLKKQTEAKRKQKQKTEAKLHKQMKALAEKNLQEQMLQEQSRIASVRAAQMQGEVNKYKALILQVISQSWLVPGSADKRLFAELLIRLAPGGTVLDVQVLKSSGNQALDRSALAAVYKASPLPVPSEPEAFDAFRQFVLKVRPINLAS